MNAHLKKPNLAPPKEPVANVLYRKEIRKWATKNKRHRDWLMKKCSEDWFFFCESFLWLFEPRPEKGRPQILPFIPWPHQRPEIEKIVHGLGYDDFGIEKSRGEGATWSCLMIILHRWRFREMQSFGIVSRNMEAADTPDDEDSLGWKLDWQIRMLPKWMVGIKAREESGGDWNRNLAGHTWKRFDTGCSITAYACTGKLASGGRKAQPLDAKLLTPTGWTKMGSIKVGDKVIGSNGTPTKVEGAYPLGKKTVYRVTFSDGSSTECCDEHLWAIQERWQRNSRKKHGYSVKKLKDLKGILVDKHGGKNVSIPVMQPAHFEEKSLPCDPYVFGALIGDGCFRSTSLIMSSADEEVIDEIQARLPEGYEVVHTENYDYRIRKIKGAGVGKRNKIKDILGHCRSWEKYIPDRFLYSSIQSRLQLLRGLMDTDGWIQKRKSGSRVKFLATSKLLSEQVVFLVQSLGGIALVRDFVPKCNGKECRTAYEICINLNINPFLLKRKSELWQPRCKYKPARWITKIEKVGVKEVQCIKVDADDQLYITDDCICTHNTAFFMDEFAKFPRGDDEDAISAVEPVTNSLLLVSTYEGADGAYFRAMQEDSSMHKIILSWEKNPTRNQNLFRVDLKKRKMLHPHEDDVYIENDYTKKFFEEHLPILVRRGYDLTSKHKMWSPWYVSRCLRPRMTPRKIAQEYDRDPGGSGSRFFPSALILSLEDRAERPYLEGEIECDLERLKVSRFTKMNSGHLKLWLKLQGGDVRPPAGMYVIGADIASGQGGDMSSNSVLSILNRETGRKVGEYANPQIKPEKLAELAVALCKWFRSPEGEPSYLIWEGNGYGGNFRDRIMETDFRNFHWRTPWKSSRKKPTKEPGWWSNKDSKRDLLGKYRWSLSEGFFENPNALALRECLCYQHGTGGKVEFISGMGDTDDPANEGESHGDRVIADALANYGMEELNGGLGSKSQVSKAQNKLNDPPPSSFRARQLKRQREAKKKTMW